MSKVLNLTEFINNSSVLRDWVDQFAQNDRYIAETILANLSFVSETDFRNSILKKLGEVCNKGEPTALYCIRQFSHKKEDYLKEKKWGKKNKHAEPLLRGVNQGSEALVCNIIRDFCKNDYEHFISHPSWQLLKTKKCKHIVMVDDVIGSGKRASEFLDKFNSYESIRSWKSGDLIRITVLAYACTVSAEKKLKRNKLNPEIKKEIKCPTVYDLSLNKSTIKNMIDVFKIYGAKTADPDCSKGYESSLSMLVFNHGCPNNVPSILWAKKNESWKSIFPNRVVGHNEAKIFTEIPNMLNLSEIIKNVDQKILATNPNLFESNEPIDIVYFILGLISQGKRKEKTISYSVGLNQEKCSKILDELVKNNLISNLHHLTDTGFSLLKYAKKVRNDYFFDVGKGNISYFPTQLRRP